MAESAIRKNLASNPRLKMEGICKSFGATRALDQVDLEVFPGEVLALVGENGAGKSTLMKVLSGAYKPDQGQMFLAGKPYEPRGPHQARTLGIGMIYQELSLAPHLSVAENILLGMEPTRGKFLRWAEMRSRAEAIIKEFGHPEIKADLPVHRLSPSAQQLVEVGRSLALGCQVLVLDEPTSSLSLKDTDRLFEIIRGLRGQGISIIYISHFLEEVDRLADRVTILRDGFVVETAEVGKLSRQEVIKKMVGREVEQLYPHFTRVPGEPILTAEELSGEEKPLGVNFNLRRGEVLGIFGLVGAGRTEMLRVLFGLDPIRQGKVSIGGLLRNSQKGWSSFSSWEAGMGLLSENRKGEGLAQGMSVADNLTLSNLAHYGAKGFISPRKQKSATRKWIHTLGIRCRGPEQKIQELSGGNQQKVALARLLTHDVDILLLDEPTRGIDVGAKVKIYEEINRLASSSKGILMVSSYLPELLGVCDRIAVMHRGHLGSALPAKELDEHALMIRATEGEGEK